MKVICKWCGKTTELEGNEPDKLTVCTKCLGEIVEAMPEETRNNPHITIVGLSGDKPLPKC